ncbi:hypothetical protein [Lewinella sp. IMCC34183]|uniref:hypothetical protein n=1 Tax=Lewinella sp. IMCC34183 TaxID=2248762 RepID=UPI000E237AAB|nr:hypothetical protein [Lewinella sp. IMCC34183]
MQCIEFRYRDKIIWSKQALLLRDWLDLILPDRLEAFRRYLASPYLVNQASGQADLLATIVGHRRRSDVAVLDVAVLLRHSFGREDFRRDRQKLLNGIKDLLEHLAAFHAHEWLRTQPVERCRQRVESLRHAVQGRLRARAIGEYESAAARISGGKHGAFHRWAAADAAYHHTLALPAQPELVRLSASASRRKAMLGNIATATYRCEGITRPPVRRKAEPMTQAPNTAEELDARLLRLHQMMQSLRQSKTHDPITYRRLVRSFVRLAPRLERDQRALLYLSLRDHMLRRYRDGTPLPAAEVAAWPVRLLRRDAYAEYRPLPPGFVTDELHLMLTGGLAAESVPVRKALIRHLHPDHREQTRRLAVIAEYFHLGKLERALDEIISFTQLGLRLTAQDDLRLKSYRLRIGLELFRQDRQNQHRKQARAALRTLEKHVERKAGKERRATSPSLKHFLRISRLLLTHIDPYSRRPRPLEEIRRLVQQPRKLYARQWLQDFLARIEERGAPSDR